MPLISNGQLVLGIRAGSAHYHCTGGLVGIHNIRGVTKRKQGIAANWPIQTRPQIIVVERGCGSSHGRKCVFAAISKICTGTPEPRDSPRGVGIYVVSDCARQNAAAAVRAVVISQTYTAPLKSVSERRSERQVGLLSYGADRYAEGGNFRSGEKTQTKTPSDLSPVS